MTSPGSPRPSRPRIPPVDDDSPEMVELYTLGGRRPLNVMKTLANHPGLLRQWAALGRFLSSDGLVPPREREIVILRVGWRAQAVYEFGQHSVRGRRAGLSDAEISAVTGDPDNGTWNDDERALLAMVDELVDDDCVSDVTWRALATRWSPAELVELVNLAGFYRCVSGFLNTMGVQLEDGVPGWPA